MYRVEKVRFSFDFSTQTRACTIFYIGIRARFLNFFFFGNVDVA